MTNLAPYLLLPGTAQQALEFYASVFGGELVIHRYSEFGRTDGPADAIAHGMLQGPVEIFAADAGADDEPLSVRGMHFALLGTADGATMHAWFAGLSEGASKVDELQQRAWGDFDGTLVDRFGVPWLLGYQPSGA
jgi:PhnB protein